MDEYLRSPKCRINILVIYMIPVFCTAGGCNRDSCAKIIQENYAVNKINCRWKFT